jgi:hypothetical protein
VKKTQYLIPQEESSLIFIPTYTYRGVRGSVVGWGTTLQAGRSRDRIPNEVDFFNLFNPSSRTMALGSTQPLTEMSTRNILGGEGRPARKADNFTAICEPIVYKMWEPQHLTTLWVSTARYRDSFTFTLYLYIFMSKIILTAFPRSLLPGSDSTEMKEHYWDPLSAIYFKTNWKPKWYLH